MVESYDDGIHPDWTKYKGDIHIVTGKNVKSSSVDYFSRTFKKIFT